MNVSDLRLPERRDTPTLLGFVFGIVVGIVYGTVMLLAWMPRHAVANAPVASGTVLAAPAASGFLPRHFDVPVLVAGSGRQVVAQAISSPQVHPGDVVRFHDDGDASRPVYLFEIEDNPLWLALVAWAAAIGIGAKMVLLRRRATSDERRARTAALPEISPGGRTLVPTVVPFAIIATALAVVEALLVRDALRHVDGLFAILLAMPPLGIAVAWQQWRAQCIEVTHEGLTVQRRPFQRRRLIRFEQIEGAEAKAPFGPDRPNRLVLRGSGLRRPLAEIPLRLYRADDVTWLCGLPQLRVVVCTPFPSPARPETAATTGS